MKKNTIIVFCICAFFLQMLICSCCSSSASSTIPYAEAHHYFFRNDATIPESPVITTQEQFDSLFGMATTMGEGGKPTAIDFTKQFVIVVVVPATDIETELRPVSLTKNDDHLTFTYQCRQGEKISYTMQPLLLIVVDKANETPNVNLVQQ